MNILVCVKRVPDVGARFDLTEDRRAIVTRHLGFTVSPHEECAVEAAIQLVEKEGGKSTVLTLGPEQAEEQLRDSLARGVEEGILLVTDGEEWDPGETSRAIVESVRAREGAGEGFDLILMGAEAADTGGCQVAVRTAGALDLPCLTGIKSLEIASGRITAGREVESGWEVFRTGLPAVVTVREGMNLPRYPSLRGTMRAKKKKVERIRPGKSGPSLVMRGLKHPPESGKQVEMLGHGPAAAPRVVEILKSLELI